MIDRKTLKKGDVVWLGEMYCGKPKVERATVRQKPRRRGGVWLDGCSRRLASEYQLFQTELTALRYLADQTAVALSAAQEEANAAGRALQDFLAKDGDAESLRRTGGR